MLSLMFSIAFWLATASFQGFGTTLCWVALLLCSMMMSPTTGISVLSVSSLSVVSWGYYLVILALYLTFLVLSYSSFSGINGLKSFLTLNVVMGLVVVWFFCTGSLLWFYIMFELSILPIFAIVMGWGYQSERLVASLSMMFYTLFASMPLLAALLYVYGSLATGSFVMMSMSRVVAVSGGSLLLALSLLTAFAVKLPMYGVHLWLPKAHVEAPVQGSMMLAAILLKLGGYGLYLFIPLASGFYVVKLLESVSIMGMMYVSVLCGRLTDMKMIVAYSSVAHMSMVLFPLLIGWKVGVLGVLLMMLAHGFVSSALFMMVYVIYLRSHSRSLLMTNGVLAWSWCFSLPWFFGLAMNLAAPPSLNFVSEVFGIMALLGLTCSNVLILLISIMGSSVYSFIMYTSVAQGRGLELSSVPPLTLQDFGVIYSHLIWALLLLLFMSIL